MSAPAPAAASLDVQPDVQPDAPPADPLALLASWLDEAAQQQVSEPMSLALATVDAQARVSNRIVRVLDAGPDGLLFTSHDSSRKARQFATSTQAAGLLYWRENGRQVEICGPVVAASQEESDALWHKRPRTVNAVSALSRQSAPLDDAGRLRREAGELAGTDEPLARPDRWRGYRLVPEVLEFWVKDPLGLHQRLRYERSADAWTVARLQP